MWWYVPYLFVPLVGHRVDRQLTRRRTVRVCMQWLTAGRGVVHAEMPAGQGVQRGVNIWINLSAADKMYAVHAHHHPSSSSTIRFCAGHLVGC